MLLMPFLGAVLSAALCAGLIWLSFRTHLAWKVLDRPNTRSLHDNPTPRIGGACLMLAVAVPAFGFGIGPMGPVLAIAAGLSVISLLDDLRGLPVGVRFAAHFAAAGLVCALYPSPSVLLLVIVALAIVWLTNLYNFMDGMDGLAGAMAVVGFGSFAVAAFIAGSASICVLAAMLAGAAAGFLVFNLPPAHVFMGDAGSIPLGFLAAAIGYIGFRDGVWSWWFPLFVFSPFIVDATVTLSRRLFAGERVWRAHRTHYYQRMVQAGLGHSDTLRYWSVLMAAAALSALLASRAGPVAGAAIAALWLVIYVLAMVWVDRRLAAGIRVGRDKS